MKKRTICIIDFGQSYLKFVLISEKYEILSKLIIKNNFRILINKLYFYDYDRIKKVIIFNVNKLSKIYNIVGISCVTHGSACFFINKRKKITSGFHFSSNFLDKKIIREFEKQKPKFSECYTLDFNKFHNLGKNFYIFSKQNKINEFMTFPSFIGWLFTKKNLIELTYISCHSYLWNFRKKTYSSLIHKTNNMLGLPKIKKSGQCIGLIKNIFFKLNKKCKFYNGMHDSSAAIHFHNKFFTEENSVFLSTGTTFVLGKIIKKRINLKKKKNFYYLSSPNKSLILSRRFQGGMIYKNKMDFDSNSIKYFNEFKKFNLKININAFLAFYTIKELIFYNKFIKNKKINLIIDGPFSKKSNFLSNLKYFNKNLEIFCAKSNDIPSLGIADLVVNNNLKLKKKNFYKYIK